MRSSACSDRHHRHLFFLALHRRKITTDRRNRHPHFGIDILHTYIHTCNEKACNISPHLTQRLSHTAAPTGLSSERRDRGWCNHAEKRERNTAGGAESRKDAVGFDTSTVSRFRQYIVYPGIDYSRYCKMAKKEVSPRLACLRTHSRVFGA